MSLDLGKYEGHTKPWPFQYMSDLELILGLNTEKQKAANGNLVADAPQLLAELREARANAKQESAKLEWALNELRKHGVNSVPWICESGL